MTRTSLIYVASAALGIAAGIATLAGVQVGRTDRTDILLACPLSNPDCFQPGQIGAPCPASDPDCLQSGEKIEVACDSSSGKGCDVESDEGVGLPCQLGVDCAQPDKQIEVACDRPSCDDVQPTEQIEVGCDGPDCSGGYRSDENFQIASANRGVEGGNG